MLKAPAAPTHCAQAIQAADHLLRCSASSVILRFGLTTDSCLTQAARGPQRRCLAGARGPQEVIVMSSPYPRDFSLLAKIQAMREEEIAKLAEQRERLEKMRRWRI